MSWQRSSPSPPIPQHGYPFPTAEHCMSPARSGFSEQDFQIRPQKGFWMFSKLWNQLNLNCSGLLRHIVLGMAKAHAGFEAMELLETSKFHSKSFLIQN